MAIKLYPVLSPIAMDKIYKEGETIALEDHQVDELKFYQAIGEASRDAPAAGKQTAAQLIELIKAAATIDEVNAILGDDTRKTVVDAAAARAAELAN